MKTFTYFTPTKSFDYEVEDNLIRRALAEMVFNREFSSVLLEKDKSVDKVIKSLTIYSLEKFIEGYDLQTKLEEDLHEDLKDYFEEYAFKSQKD